MARGLALVGMLLLASCDRGDSPRQSPTTAPAAPPPAANALPAPETGIATNELNSSVVVTHDLDFGGPVPSVAEALTFIERRYQPDAPGAGRTFAILEAFTQGDGEPGRLRLSLRLSTEKLGLGEIVFRRTGQSLWKSRIVPPASHAVSTFNAGALTVLFEPGDGRSFTVDGSRNPASILDATLKEAGVPVAQLWPDGQDRELAFIYSACGCPIKVKCRRAGERTLRLVDTQVIFPDDPAVMQVITHLMRW